MTFIAVLGPSLNFPQWALDLSLTTHVGNPPMGTIQTVALTVMSAAAAVLVAGGRHQVTPEPSSQPVRY